MALAIFFNNVYLSVCVCTVIKLWGSLESPKWLGLAEIWYTCSFWVNIWGVFLNFFENFHFWARALFLGPNWPKNLRGNLESPNMIGFC